jgi:hypothetical protein
MALRWSARAPTRFVFPFSITAAGAQGSIQRCTLASSISGPQRGPVLGSARARRRTVSPGRVDLDDGRARHHGARRNRLYWNDCVVPHGVTCR